MKRLAKLLTIVSIAVLVTDFFTLANQNFAGDQALNDLGSHILLLSVVGLVLGILLWLATAILKTEKHNVQSLAIPPSKKAAPRLGVASFCVVSVIALSAAVVLLFSRINQPGESARIADIRGDNKVVVTIDDGTKKLGGVGVCIGARLGAQGGTPDSRCSVTDYESGEVHFDVKAGKYYIYPDLRSMDEFSLDPKLDKRNLEIEVLPGSTNEVRFMMTPRG